MIKIELHTETETTTSPTWWFMVLDFLSLLSALFLSSGFLFLFALTFTARHRASEALQLLSTGAARPPGFAAKTIPQFLTSVPEAHPTSLHVSFSSLDWLFLLGLLSRVHPAPFSLFISFVSQFSSCFHFPPPTAWTCGLLFTQRKLLTILFNLSGRFDIYFYFSDSVILLHFGQVLFWLSVLV